MGASKTANYTSKIREISIITRALAHPSRLFIFEELKKKEQFRSTDFSRKMGLSESTIHHHLKMMKDAQLIELEFIQNAYSIHLVNDPVNSLIQFLDN